MMRTLLALLIPALFFPLRVDALPTHPRQVTDGTRQTVQRRGDDGRLEVWAAATQDAVRVDGRLDEPIWRQAQPVSGFLQAEPLEGQPASEQTEVWVAFDQDHLYIAAFCYDRQPDGVVVNNITRDFPAGNQDAFEVILDTFADRRNGYIFATNAEGAQVDQQISNEGRVVNTSWDVPWSVATQRNGDGWTLEMAIPFKALRFQEAGQIWGINFSRLLRRKNEVDFWAPVPRSYNLSRLSLAGNLRGLSAGSSGRDLRVKPYGLASAVRETGGDVFDRNMSIGADMKYGVTRGLALDLTVRPDFAQAEADEQQVNLTQFSQFYPEKRDFFLENAGLFYVGDAARRTTRNTEPRPDTDLLLFHSRSLGLTPAGRALPITGGFRLSGHEGRLNIGALAVRVQDKYGVPANDYAVARLGANVHTNSDVGVMFLMRRAAGGEDYNRVYGLDSNVRLPAQVDWSSYIVLSETPGVSGGQYAYRTSINREGNFFHVKAGVMTIGENFNDELGYYRRVADRKWFLDTGVRVRVQSLRQVGIREMHPHVVWDYHEDLAGRMAAKKLHTGYTFFLDQGGTSQIAANPSFERIAEPFRIHRGSPPIPPGAYSWTDYSVDYSTNPSRPLSGRFSYAWGGLWTGTQKTLSVSVAAKPSFNFNASLAFSRTAAELELPEIQFVRSFWTLRANYSFTTNMFVDAFAQYDPDRRLLNANVRFNLIHRPLSDLYIVWNEQRFMTDEGVPPGRGLIVKFTQMMAF